MYELRSVGGFVVQPRTVVPSSYPSGDSSVKATAATTTSTSLQAIRKYKNQRASGSDSFVRIQPRSVRGGRQCFEVQTKVVTLERIANPGSERSDDSLSKQTVELHAQLHFGSHEYFDYYNSPQFKSLFDTVHYELLIDDSLVEYNNNAGYRQRQLKSSPNTDYPLLMASPTDQSTASQYGLECQVDVINYSQPNWIHADMTRQEFIAKTTTTSAASSNQRQPLWALASSSTSFPGAEPLMALIRPSTPSVPLSSPVTRRLFSNLFLPGTALTSAFRTVFWLLVPAPELFVMVLDWSSVVPKPSGVNVVTPIAVPVLEAILSGNLREARQLVFGQMIVAGQRQQGTGGNDLLITQRNEHAMNVLDRMLEMEKDDSGEESSTSTALLYGAMHCSGLARQLQSRGFVWKSSSWRTAWSVTIPQLGTSQSPNSGPLQSFAAVASPAAVAIGLVILPLYLMIGGLDWISTMENVVQAAVSSSGPLSGNRVGTVVDVTAEIMLYLLRHVLLYLGLAKFVIEWDGSVNLFGER